MGGTRGSSRRVTLTSEGVSKAGLLKFGVLSIVTSGGRVHLPDESAGRTPADLFGSSVSPGGKAVPGEYYHRCNDFRPRSLCG